MRRELAAEVDESLDPSGQNKSQSTLNWPRWLGVKKVKSRRCDIF